MAGDGFAVRLQIAGTMIPTHQSLLTPMADSLDELARALRAFSLARGWQIFHAPKNLASALVVEAGELLEHFQWLTEEQSRQLSSDAREAVADEMADVLLYLVQLASEMNIDLLGAARRKMAANERRFPLIKGGVNT